MLIQKILLIILTTTTLSSCHKNYKVCNCISTEEPVKIYSDVLNELVEHHFYNLYLGKDQEQIFKLETLNSRDTAKIRRETIQLQNKIFNNTDRLCNIYLDTTYSANFKPWKDYLIDTSRHATEIKDLIIAFSNDGQSVIDSLNSMQMNLDPEELQLCTSKLLSIRDKKTKKGICEIGIVSFSKVFLDETKTKGLLCYTFRCGALCGKSELLIIEKINNRWTINEIIRSRIS
jgi:hypothetical protein